MIRRPILRYHGGKWRLAPWIISHFPPHRAYIEPFGGGASVLLAKKPVLLECYNDLDGAVVNLFRVLRDPCARARLAEICALTPFSVEECRESQRGKKTAWVDVVDPIERARRLMVSSWMTHGSNGASGRWNSGFRRVLNDNRGRMPSMDWATIPEVINAVSKRFLQVVIEQMPALELIQRYDAQDALFYVDPPYMLDTRGKWASAGYRHDMTEKDHRDLADVLQSCVGTVVLSGYPHGLYDRLYKKWRRVETKSQNDRAKRTVEVLWINRLIGAPSEQGHLNWSGEIH